MRLIYHLVPKAVWDKAAAETYAADSLATEGFIHCSNADQVARSANRFYAATDELLVLHLDAGRLASPLRDEASQARSASDGAVPSLALRACDEAAGGGELFPHVYGPLNRSAVVLVQPLQRGADGRWVFVP